MVPDLYKEKAFLGKMAESASFKKIDKTAEKVNQILNPIDGAAKRKETGESIKLIRDLGIQVDNVSTLKETLVNVNKSQIQKENADGVLDVLAKGTYIAMRYGKNDEVRADLCSGSVEKIENRLPEPLKGLGERIRSNIIDEPEIIKALDLLDKTRIRAEKAGEVGKTVLAEEINNSIRGLMKLNVDSTKEDQLGMVMAFLGVEVDKIRVNLAVGGTEAEGATGKNKRMYRGPEVFQRKPNEDGEKGWEQRSFDTLYETFVRNEKNQVELQWYNARPPEWFLEMDEMQKSIIEIRVKYADAAARKREVRNALPVEKLRTLIPEVRLMDFLRLWEHMPGYRKAMGEIVRTLCGKEMHEGENGIMSLRLESDKGLTPGGKVEKWLNNFDTFREEIAGKISKSLGLTKEQSDAAVSAAWNHLYMGDLIESADFYRQLLPTEVLSDKIRTFYHLWTKGMGKLGVWKIAGVESGTGKEEPFVAPDMAEWLADRIQNEPGFRARLTQGGDLAEFLPETLAVSQLETQKVKLKNGEETTLAYVLLKGLEDKVDTMSAKGDGSIFQDHNDMLQAVDFLASAIKGKQALDVGKGGSEWISVFNESTALIRQQDMLPRLMPDGKMGKGHLNFVDNPRFYWSVLLCSMGFKSEQLFPMLPTEKLGKESTENNYTLMVRELIERVTIRLPMQIKNDVRNKAREMLGGKNFMDPFRRGIQNDRDSFQRVSGKKKRM